MFAKGQSSPHSKEGSTRCVSPRNTKRKQKRALHAMWIQGRRPRKKQKKALHAMWVQGGHHEKNTRRLYTLCESKDVYQRKTTVDSIMCINIICIFMFVSKTKGNWIMETLWTRRRIHSGVHLIGVWQRMGNPSYKPYKNIYSLT